MNSDNTLEPKTWPQISTELPPATAAHTAAARCYCHLIVPMCPPQRQLPNTYTHESPSPAKPRPHMRATAWLRRGGRTKTSRGTRTPCSNCAATLTLPPQSPLPTQLAAAGSQRHSSPLIWHDLTLLTAPAVGVLVAAPVKVQPESMAQIHHVGSAQMSTAGSSWHQLAPPSAPPPCSSTTAQRTCPAPRQLPPAARLGRTHKLLLLLLVMCCRPPAATTSAAAASC